MENELAALASAAVATAASVYAFVKRKVYLGLMAAAAALFVLATAVSKL